MIVDYLLLGALLLLLMYDKCLTMSMHCDCLAFCVPIVERTERWHASADRSPLLSSMRWSCYGMFESSVGFHTFIYLWDWIFLAMLSNFKT